MIRCFPYGLSNKNLEEDVIYYEDASTAMSRNEIVNKNAADEYNCSVGKNQRIKLQKSSEELGVIIKKHSNINLVLKIDCEGEEYRILEDLNSSGLLSDIQLVMLEWHYGKKEWIVDVLRQAGFNCWLKNESVNMGMLVAFNCKLNQGWRIS